MADGLLTFSTLGRSWHLQPDSQASFLKRLQVELEERGLIDDATWMVATSVRASRAAAGAPNTETSKKGTLLACRITPLDALKAD